MVCQPLELCWIEWRKERRGMAYDDVSNHHLIGLQQTDALHSSNVDEKLDQKVLTRNTMYNWNA